MHYGLPLVCLVTMLVLFVGIDYAHAQTPAVTVNSTTANGTPTYCKRANGTIEIQLTLSEAYSFNEFSIAHNKHHFGQLDEAYSVTTVTIGSKHYALVAAHFSRRRPDNRHNLPRHPHVRCQHNSQSKCGVLHRGLKAFANMDWRDHRRALANLMSSYSVTTTKIGSKYYALVAAYASRVASR